MTHEFGDVLAVASDYEGLLAALIARRKELQLPQLAVDEISGLQGGYTGKIEVQQKRLGVLSLTCLLGALGLELVIRRTTPHHERQGRLSPSDARCGPTLGARRTALMIEASAA